MNEDELYALMMDALDGELSETGRSQLESHLRARPHLAREWQAMQAIDALFRRSPVLSPAAGFTQRTLARLPASRQRLWLGIVIYFAILASGIIPLAAVAWLGIRALPVLAQPALWRGLAQGAAEMLGVVQVILFSLLRGAGELVQQQPNLVAWMLVLSAIILAWAALYRRLVLQPGSAT